MKKAHITERQFASLALHPQIISGLSNAGYVHCTPIQELALPVLLSGQDIAGQAQTGTGKTLTFLTATFHHLLIRSQEDKERISPHPRAIIMAPTRELAIQIYHDALFLSESTGLSIQLAYGGDSFESQKLKIQSGTDVLVGTVGRIIDFYKQEIFHLNDVEVVVLDEADRMFDLGFIKDIRYLFKRMPSPAQRLNMLFSATLSYRVQELAFEHMNAPQHISVEPDQKTGHRIQEELFYPSNLHKMPLLQTLIEQDWPDRAIIFANTKHRCNLIYRHLLADGHRVGLLTGDVAQKQREGILQRFTRGELDLLVATDVAARGLHIPQVTHVYNYDLPNDSEDYVHRIGRTGRAGECGHSISFACEEFAINLTAIETYIEHCIPVSDYDADALIPDLPKPHRPKRDGRMQDRTMRMRHSSRRHASKSSTRN